MTVSVFTPIHRNDQATLQRAYKSLKSQMSLPDEWIVLLNGDALNMDTSFLQVDKMVRIVKTEMSGNVGALKELCCEAATGDILVELDYDDELTPYAINAILREFEDKPNAVFVYSNFAEVTANGSPFVYSSEYGWQSREFGNLMQMVAFPASAHYMRRIEWAPNHVRAFLKRAYLEVGGYDKALPVGDDHDLVCRFYLAYGEHGFSHIDQCLYLYHRHDGNTSLGQRNSEVQAQVEINYVRYSEAMYLRWAKDNDLLALDLGGRFHCPEGYLSVDIHQPADIIADLNSEWPWADNSVGVLRAYHVLEHLDDTVHFMNEAYRVLAPGGFLLIEVPSVSGGGAAAYGDPTHKKHFHPHTFDYFTTQAFSEYIRPQYKGVFQESRKVEYLWREPERWIISAHLIAVKGEYKKRWCGLKNWQ